MTEPPGGPPAEELLEIAIGAARRAGRLLVDRRPDDLRVAETKTSPTDVVTEMDTAAEQLIVEAVQGLRPDDAVLGEEGGGRAGQNAGQSAVRWIVDPIDGTVNYLYGLPGWAVSIAAEVGDTVTVGVVHVPGPGPGQGELFTAVRGRGARRNGLPIRCNEGVELAQALVATGFSYRAELRARQAALLRGVLPRVRDIRRVGSAASDLCMVACGRVDAYYESGLHRWDVAAGALIAAEAGARVGGIGGRDSGGGVSAAPDVSDGADPAEATLVAAGPGVFGPLQDLLLSAAAGWAQ
ncbi:MAG: inositol monophosphatase family protein [Streptomycetales bacterium]